MIEGFYGPPWTPAARTDVVEHLAARGMNAYVYAPKSDPKHRDRWREPYDPAELDDFAELAACCARVGTRLGFAISPGLDIDHSDPGDRAALLAKIEQMLDVGVTWIVLAVDDIPAREGLGTEQAMLTTWLVEACAGRTEPVRWSLVPTEYVGTRPTPYLAALASGLPPDVDVFWTGPTVCSPTVSAADARAWKEAVGDRPLILWDNFPVNDAVMERELHLGPYRGRDPDLVDVLAGVLCNPMLQARASLVALGTAAEFLTDPSTYDEHAAWERAIADVGGDDTTALRALARACCDGPLTPARELPARALLQDVAADPSAPDAIAALRCELDALRRAGGELRDERLLGELGPWLEQGRRETDAGLAAVRLLELVAAGADPEDLMMQAFTLLFLWSVARDGSSRVVLGPRFALHPAVVQREDGSPALDVGLALREDESVVDGLARLALDTYAQASK